MTHEHPEPPRTAGLDALLRSAVPGLRLAGALAGALTGRPLTVARRGAGLAAELARIGLGRSRLAPGRDDPRYADPVWRDNPLLRRAVQVHLATAATAQDLVGDARLSPADDRRARAAARAVIDALAPANLPVDPAVLRVPRGAATQPRTPAPAPFEVGTDLAVTPGAVVLRTPVLELIQYLPQTESVRDVPLVVVPPVQGRHYLADLAPGRSIVEHLVRGGQQVFAISWHNPGPEQAGWDLDVYGQAVLDAMDAAEHIARTPRTALMAFGSGAVITAMLLAHLAAIGAQERVAAVTLAGAVLDRDGGGTGAVGWPGPPTAIETPEARFWSADATRVPAGLRRDLLDVAGRGALAVPGAASLLGTALDLAKVDRDCYVVAGTGDRAAPWPDVHRGVGLLGGACRFVLADGGRLGSVVSPPGEAGVSFRAATPAPGGPAGGPEGRWLALAAPEPASWWKDHLAWLAERTGPTHDAPPGLGGRGMHALAPAPGEYVLEP